METQVAVRGAVQGFDDQRAIGEGLGAEMRHVEADVRVPAGIGFGEELVGFGFAGDGGGDFCGGHRLFGVIEDADMQRGAFSGEPGLRVDQFDGK